MELLITGGAGFIGSNFIKYMLSKHVNIVITIIDKLTYAGNLRNLEKIENNPGHRFVKGDIADQEEVANLFNDGNFDAIVNFAAESHVDRSILDAAPFIETNG